MLTTIEHIFLWGGRGKGGGAVTSNGTKSACTCSLNVLGVWLCLCKI